MKILTALIGASLLCGICQTELAAQTTQSSEKVASLDKKIAELKTARDVASSRAYIAGMKADEVIETDWTGYRRYLAVQASYQQQVEDLNKQIAELEKQRAEALRK